MGQNKKNILVAVLMTVHNRRDCTLNCLRHLYSNVLEKYTICVYLVDDGCTDGTADAVRAMYPDVKVICGDGSLFWNRGMLHAWQEAAKDSPDYYLWLNDDTILYANALQMMFDAYKQSESLEVIICGSTHSTNNEDVVTYGGRFHKRLLVPNGHLQEAEWVNGNLLLIPSCVVERIGMLDPFFRHAKGDYEYGIRARKNGIKLYVAPQYIGSCDKNTTIPKCYNPSIPFRERWLFLSHPLGPIPKETLYYCRKCLPYGTIRAMWYISRAYMKTLFPRLF